MKPLAITLALLLWAWIWGAMGLILAAAIVGATKTVCDLRRFPGKPGSTKTARLKLRPPFLE